MGMDSIGFPNLGIWFKHVGSTLNLFGFEIAFYGILIALAMFAGIMLAMHLAEKTGQSADMYFDFAIIAMVVSLIGARIYYVVFQWDYYRQHLPEILNFRGGGLAIYGGIMAGVLCAVVFSGVRKVSLSLMLDTAMPALALGQGIGRWGNFFNREAFGQYTGGITAMALPLEMAASSDVTALMKEHLLVKDGISFILVHPTFLYESLWDFFVAAFLVFLTFHRKKKVRGGIFAAYLMLYGLGRFFIESLRIDQLLLPGTQIPVSMVVSVLIMIFGAGLMVYRLHMNNKGI